MTSLLALMLDLPSVIYPVGDSKTFWKIWSRISRGIVVSVAMLGVVKEMKEDCDEVVRRMSNKSNPVRVIKG